MTAAVRTVDLASAVPVAPTADDAFAGLRAPGLVSSEFSYGRDEEIFGEGEPADYVYQVVSGAVRTYKLLSDGRRHIGAFHVPGDVFGLESGTEHRLAAEAVVDTTVRLVKRSALDRAASVDVAVARALWSITAGELGHAEDHMLLLGRKTAGERVATFLLEMDRRLTRSGAVALPMSRRDIGDYLGLTLETVSRTLSDMQTRGLVRMSSSRQIQLKDRTRLEDLDA